MLTDINRKNMLDHIKINNYWTNSIKPFYQLARLDKPIGFFLLMWPCWFGLSILSLNLNLLVFWLVSLPSCVDKKTYLQMNFV